MLKAESCLEFPRWGVVIGGIPTKDPPAATPQPAFIRRSLNSPVSENTVCANSRRSYGPDGRYSQEELSASILGLAAHITVRIMASSLLNLKGCQFVRPVQTALRARPASPPPEFKGSSWSDYSCTQKGSGRMVVSRLLWRTPSCEHPGVRPGAIHAQQER